MNQFSCLTDVPLMTKGLVREMRVRWMLEELELPYEPIVYPHPETKKEPYLKLQPFGQVPYFKSGDLLMFETGAILIHLAEKHKKFLPTDEMKRAHVMQWMFAALTSVEPYIFHNFLVNWDPDSPESSKARAKAIVDDKLKVLSRELGDKEYFAEGFSIAEIMMTTALRAAQSRNSVSEYPNLMKYLERMQARPAFQRALNEHVKLYPET